MFGKQKKNGGAEGAKRDRGITLRCQPLPPGAGTQGPRVKPLLVQRHPPTPPPTRVLGPQLLGLCCHCRGVWGGGLAQHPNPWVNSGSPNIRWSGPKAVSGRITGRTRQCHHRADLCRAPPGLCSASWAGEGGSEGAFVITKCRFLSLAVEGMLEW